MPDYEKPHPNDPDSEVPNDDAAAVHDESEQPQDYAEQPFDEPPFDESGVGAVEDEDTVEAAEPDALYRVDDADAVFVMNESDASEPVDPLAFEAVDAEYGVEPEAEIFSADDFEAPTPLDAPLDVPPATTVTRSFDDLTLTEVLQQFFRTPRYTWASVWQIANDERRGPVPASRRTQREALAAAGGRAAESPVSERLSERLQKPGLWQLGLYLLAFLLGIYGSSLLISAPIRSETGALARGAPFLWLAFGLWLLTDVLRYRRQLVSWWVQLDSARRWHLFMRTFPVVLMLVGLYLLIDSMSQPREVVLIYVAPGVQLLLAGLTLWFFLDIVLLLASFYVSSRAITAPDSWEAFFARRQAVWLNAETDWPSDSDKEMLPLPWYTRIHPLRIFLVLGGAVLSLVTWWGTAGNTMSDPVFYLWLLSILFWSLAFAPSHWRPLPWARAWADRIRAFSWRQHRWTILALLLLMMLAASFRLAELDRLPPEMTSDHVEKILDAQRVTDGQRSIFFANNGGREPFQMYALALFAQLPGQGINFNSLKLLAVLESLLTLPILYWMAREILRPADRRVVALTALLLVGLVAVSYWHTSITRLALRIVLTPMVSALLLIYLTRALRHNHRADYIKAALILGFGLYMYQAVRMLPVIIVLGVLAAFYFSARNIQDRLRYIANLSVLVLISFVIFLPMFHYSVENPEEFWRRTTGRLLGDEIIETRLPDGTLTLREATLVERVEAFNENVPTLMSNIRAVLLMFNWKGDVAWINGFPNYPALDLFTGTLFILGWAAWFVLVMRHRDLMLALLPLFLFVLLLPSALSIAFPVENPSYTRTSGAIPIVYLVAAYPLALLVQRITRLWPDWRGQISAVSLCAVVILGANLANTRVYFEDFRESYLVSSLPYSDPGRVLRGFAISDGAYGNAFMIAYPFWWDHRAVGMEAGRNDWPNGIIRVEDVPLFLRDSFANAGSRYQFDPMRDIMFFYHIADEASAQQLSEWFPGVTAIRYPSYQEGDDFMVFRVPALGGEGFLDFLAASELN